MNELLEQLKSKAGLDDGQAGSAVQTVLDFIKDKLPAPIASQIENLLGGGEDGGEDGGGLGDIADKAKDALGGMFGGGGDK